MILRVTPGKRPTIEEILEQPFFKDDPKSEKELTSHSTTNTEDSRAKVASLQYLSESCNPKKMAELQKILEREHQKQTYPPFHAPKAVNKIGTGTTIPAESNEKAYSPMHSKKLVPGAPGSNLGGINYFRPPQQFIPPNSNNKTFSGLLNTAKSPSSQPPENPNLSNQSINFINPNKNNLGFGRYS
jgi:hypothetical protein